MKKRKIGVTCEQLNHFVSRLQALPSSPIGGHLTEVEYMGYTLDLLTQEEVQSVDQHLASCADCAAEMARLFSKPEVWRLKGTRMPRLDFSELPDVEVPLTRGERLWRNVLIKTRRKIEFWLRLKRHTTMLVDQAERPQGK